MISLRTPETEARYTAVKLLREPAECGICNDLTIKEFTHWRIVANQFPYDAIAAVHHMAVPKRHASEESLTDEEWAELDVIKHDYVAEQYEIALETMPKKKSIPGHFHLHLLVLMPD